MLLSGLGSSYNHGEFLFTFFVQFAYVAVFTADSVGDYERSFLSFA